MKFYMILIVVLCLMVTSAANAQKVFVPIPLSDKIKAVESTRLDIGEPKAVFDGKEDTLIRTPSINPAYVMVEFKEPVKFDHIRLQLIDCRHIWSIAIADNMSDLRTKSGSYRLLIKDKDTSSGQVEVDMNEQVTAGALQLDVKRMEGDDYVHIFEVMLCKPGIAESLKIVRLNDRRDYSKVTEVSGKITVPIYTVLVFMATAKANGSEIKVNNNVIWKPAGEGVVPWKNKPGEFLVKKVGEHKLIARYGNKEKEIIIKGTRRDIKNREPDLDVWFIERLPRIDYDGPNNGLPLPGSNVTWRAHVYNWGKEDIPAVFEWKLDGKVVAKGKAVIPVGPPNTQAKIINFPWKWDPARHDLTFTVKPSKPLKEVIKANNTVTIQTNAITVGFWVEQSLWEFFHEHQHRMPTNDANSFADWSQRMMRQWNRMFSEAKYEIYPAGIKERVRLDRLVIVPDFALPLNGGLPSNDPDMKDKTIDMQWGHESGDIGPGTIVAEDHWWSPEKAIKAWNSGRIRDRKEDPPFWCGLGYIHEMGHARYLIDSYGFDVHSGEKSNPEMCNIKVTDEKGSILGRYMPENSVVHYCRYPGNMSSSYWFYSPYEVMAWNRVLGQRAREGNYNSPGTIGEYLQEIPKKLIYQYFDTEGNPLSDADVWVYRAHGNGNGWYTKIYEDTPGIKGKTDSEGKIVLDKTMFAEDGKLIHTYGAANSVVLVRLSYKGQHYFTFEEASDPNIAYNLGFKDEYTFKRQIKLRTGEPTVSEWNPAQNWDLPGTSFDKRP